MKTAPLSLESIKLHLIWNREQAGTLHEVPTLDELVEYLIESLEESDKTNSTKAENLLTRIGKPAIPALLQGLKHPSTNVKSVCAMALIRIGQPAVDELKAFYVRNANRDKVRWVAEFVLTELGEALPVVISKNEELDVLPQKVLQLSKVG